MTDPPSSPPDIPHAKRSLGQNFLIDRNIQRKIVAAIDPSPDDEVLEIGPGTGALTDHLAGTVRRLVLVELDDDLARNLEARFASDPSIQVVHRDVLTTDLEELSSDIAGLKVIGNIPYNITTPIIFHLLERRPRPLDIVLMVQREVADRLLAPSGSRTYGALSVGVQALAHTSRVLQVGRNAFRPPPDVESTVIRITPFAPPPFEPHTEIALRTLTRAAFGQRRKQFQRILRDAFHLSPDDVRAIESETGYDLRGRPEAFSPDSFVQLAISLTARGHLPASKI